MNFINFIIKSCDGQIITIFEQRENATVNTLLRTIDVIVHGYFPIYTLKYGDIEIEQNNETLNIISSLNQSLSNSIFSEGGEIVVTPIISYHIENLNCFVEQKQPIDWNEIEKVPYQKENIFNQTSCPICFDDFKIDETLINLKNCKHLFHQDCIIPWLEKSELCPLCRKKASQIPHETECVDTNIDDLLTNLLNLI